MDAYDKAISILTLREHSSKELAEKLVSKGYGKDEIDSAVRILEEEGYLSDERYAECFVRSALKKRAEGKSLVMMRLQEKGVSKALTSEKVNAAWENEEYLPALEKEWGKLYKKYGEAKAVSKLMAKGFTPSEIRKAREKENEE